MTSRGSKSEHNWAKTQLQAPFQPRQVRWWSTSIKWSWTQIVVQLPRAKNPQSLSPPACLRTRWGVFMTNSIIHSTFVPIYFSRNYQTTDCHTLGYDPPDKIQQHMIRYWQSTSHIPSPQEHPAWPVWGEKALAAPSHPSGHSCTKTKIKPWKKINVSVFLPSTVQVRYKPGLQGEIERSSIKLKLWNNRVLFSSPKSTRFEVSLSFSRLSFSFMMQEIKNTLVVILISPYQHQGLLK